ncbi:MAG: hypothetical protein D8M59_11950 [Planctomycetes bacterium]|nr:hypothetical protein [Planctomycetota bacterium]NOG53517.1 hypothetical protein [Planctomycetota bacterium]
MNINDSLTSSLASPNPAALQLQALYQPKAGDRADTRETVRLAAAELVAGTLIQPMFRMMREDPLNSDLIPVSSGEKAFQQMLDSEMAKHVIQASRLPLVDALTDRFMNTPRSQRPAPTPAATRRIDRHA